MLCYCVLFTLPFMPSRTVNVQVIIRPDPVTTLNFAANVSLLCQREQVLPCGCVAHAHTSMVKQSHRLNDGNYAFMFSYVHVHAHVCICTCFPVPLATNIKLIRSCIPLTLADHALSRVQIAMTPFNSSSDVPPPFTFLWVFPSFCTRLYNSGHPAWSSAIMPLIEKALKCATVSGPFRTICLDDTTLSISD